MNSFLTRRRSGQSLTRSKNSFLFSRSKLCFRNMSSAPLLHVYTGLYHQKHSFTNFFPGGQMRKRLLRKQNCSEKHTQKHFLPLRKTENLLPQQIRGNRKETVRKQCFHYKGSLRLQRNYLTSSFAC